jgi:hypothetical protein
MFKESDMAFGDWDEVIKVYEEVYGAPKYSKHRYAEHITNMRRLVPQLKAHPDFQDVLPGTSHATLFMQLPQKRTTLNVWYNRRGVYTVYLNHPEQGDYDELVVETEDIIPTLQVYLQKMRRE